ncbi:hypothetical protein [Glaciihabitans tibetensis]|uniref:hypothetical protein n=1 Tax=Glaciihabitans tibetensis TaxID=1266600 RepID=UPI0011B22BDA|nr:hypothetical protein [Glaciihabitans tibetensis]
MTSPTPTTASSLRYKAVLDSTGVRLAGEPLLEGETDEPFAQSPYEVGNAPLPQVIKDGYVLPEHSDPVDAYYRSEITIGREQFLAVAKANNATPAILVCRAPDAIRNAANI